jgi:hypothetical protein
MRLQRLSNDYLYTISIIRSIRTLCTIRLYNLIRLQQNKTNITPLQNIMWNANN